MNRLLKIGSNGGYFCLSVDTRLKTCVHLSVSGPEVKGEADCFDCSLGCTAYRVALGEGLNLCFPQFCFCTVEAKKSSDLIELLGSSKEVVVIFTAS